MFNEKVLYSRVDQTYRNSLRDLGRDADGKIGNLICGHSLESPYSVLFLLRRDRIIRTLSLQWEDRVLIGRIEDWALIQAKLRMEEEGINLDYKVD